jgi:hypothetical protein
MIDTIARELETALVELLLEEAIQRASESTDAQ